MFNFEKFNEMLYDAVENAKERDCGEVIDFVWGNEVDWREKKKEVVNKFWEEIYK